MTAGRVTIIGMEEVQAKLNQVSGDLSGAEMIAGMKDATLIVTRDAKINAPVDTGRLRSSITPDVRVIAFAGAPHVQGVVGSNVVYAPFQELGTIHMTGRRYLQRALEANIDRIYQLVGKVVSKIVAR